MTDLERFGQRMAQLRREKAVAERRDIGQKDVAKAVKVTAGNYSRYEAGLVKPRDDVLGRLADYYGVTRAWLLWGEGERVAQTPRLAVKVADLDPPAARGRKRHG